MFNAALAHAILDSRKKKKTICRLIGAQPYQLSRALSGIRPLSPKQREKLSALLGKAEHELFPPDEVSA